MLTREMHEYVTVLTKPAWESLLGAAAQRRSQWIQESPKVLSWAPFDDLRAVISSQVRLFTYDCLLCRKIKNQNDHRSLQTDLKKLEEWADPWGMKFNAQKCYILSIPNKSTHLDELDNQID